MSECVGRHQAVVLVYVVKEKLEKPFKGDNVKPLIKRQIMKTWSVISLRKLRKQAAFAMLFWFSVTNQSLENGFDFPQ